MVPVEVGEEVRLQQAVQEQAVQWGEKRPDS